MVRLASLALILTGCAGVSSISGPQEKIVQELDLTGTLDGVPWQGIAVGQNFKVHQVEVHSKTAVNYFVAQSCTRDNKFEDVIQPTEIFHWDGNDSWTWMFTPSPGLEDTGDCPLRLQAFSKQIGAGQAYGLMLFKNPRFTLPAENICNGDDGQASGTSICQSLNGLRERLKFKRQVMVAAPNPDNTTLPNQCQGKFVDAYTYEYIMPLGECVLIFGTTRAPYEYGIHMAYGYNRRVYRGN